MTDVTPTDDGSTGDAGGTGAGTQAPEGFVPLADLEREQARARDFQARADRAAAELRAAQAGTGKTVTEKEDDGGFDPQAFRSSLLGDVSNVVRMAQAVTSLREKYPYADDSIYDRVGEYGNVDALRIAVEDSHLRVSKLVDAQKTSIESKLREEFGDKLGGGAPPAGGQGLPAGDPTPEQLSKLSLAEMNELEIKSPGLIERVLRSAT